MAEKTDLEAGAFPLLAGNEGKKKPGLSCENPFPEETAEAKPCGMGHETEAKRRMARRTGIFVAVCAGGGVGLYYFTSWLVHHSASAGV